MARFAYLIAASLLAVPATAVAQRNQATVTADTDRAVISYGDLDMASSEGQRILKRRLSSAIEQVCGSYANVREYSEEERIGSCRTSAWASADRQLAARPSDQRLALLIAR